MMRRSIRARTKIGIVFTIGVIGTGCDSAASESAATAVVRDSAGIRIVENAGPADGAEVRTVSPEPFVRIGAIDGAAHDQLHRVRHVLRLTSGVIVLADGGTQELRFFDNEGAHIRSVGGTGSGPGEFERIAYMRRLAGDSLLVYDGSSRRITILAPDGTLARDYVPYRSDGTAASVEAALRDGTLLIRLPDPERTAPQSEDYRRSILRLGVLRPDGSEAALGSYAGSEAQQRVSSPAPSVMSISMRTLPYSRNAFSVVAGDMIVAGSSDTWETHFHEPAGRLAMIVRSTHIPVRVVDDEALAEYAEAIANDPRRTTITSAERPAPAPRQVDVTTHASHVPAFAALLGTEGGGVWVRRYRLLAESAPSLWDVISADGVFRHTIELPAGFSPLYADDEVVLGTISDDLGVEYVHGYGLGSG